VLLTAIAWWLGRGPREPVFKGKKLSWWFTDGYDKQGAPRLTGDELRSLGPDAVRWLSYKAGQSSIVDIKEPSNNANAVRRFFWDLHERWFHEGSTKFSRVRFEAVVALGNIGPEAAPAIPSLLKALRCSENDTRLLAAESSMRLGSAAWPAVARAVRNGDLRSRYLLLERLDFRWRADYNPEGRTADFSPSDFAQLVDFLIPLTFDVDETIRGYAQGQLGGCIEWWNEKPEFDAGFRLMIENAERLGPAARRKAVDPLAGFEFRPHAAAIVPHLSALAKTSDELTGIHILCVLAILDTDNHEWVDRLNELATSSDKVLAQAAEEALIRANQPLPEKAFQ
jgi:hypothetical protein